MYDLRDIEKCFPNFNEMSWGHDLTYNEMIRAMDLHTVMIVEEEDYQGDTIALLRTSDNDYGILTFSWGSCSGCDALKACDNYQDLENLRAQLFNKINWAKDHKKYGDASPKYLAQWWLDRDVEALETVDSDLNTKFCNMLKSMFEIKVSPPDPIKKAEKILSANGIEIQIREHHDKYYAPWILMKYNGEVILDEQCVLNNCKDGGEKREFDS